MLKTSPAKLKNQKASGLNKFTNEIPKFGGGKLARELGVLRVKVITHRKLGEWRESLNIPIFKKGQKDDRKNYRGIT